MSNLLATLVSSSRALGVYDRVLDVTQNNVANASTPGYARQSVALEALPFNDSGGTLGGVWVADVESARNEYSEASVRQRTTDLGHTSQSVASLTSLESVIQAVSTSGLAGALDQFYQSASNWSVSVNDPTARQQVLDRAVDLAAAFRQTSAAVSQTATNAEKQTQTAVDHINTIAAQLQHFNKEARTGSSKDPGVDAGVHSALEELAHYVDFTAMHQEDGSVTVLIGGQTALVVGANRYELDYSRTGNSNGSSNVVISSADGRDITSTITSGSLGALLDYRNRVLGGITGSDGQPGSLNQLAQSVADRVNTIFSSGQVSGGAAPVWGTPIFTYDASETNYAVSMQVTAGFQASDLAAIDPGPPFVSNGIPLRMANLANPTDPADRIGTLSFSEYFGEIGAGVGRALSDANSDVEVQQNLVAQAKQLREQTSGVSLDEEATILMQFQRAYQAMSRLIKVLDELTQEAIGILR
jgi:flagellar hook-associated protein 1 FlgK